MDGRRRWFWARLPFSDQCLQVGFEACTIVARVLKKQLDDAPLAGTEVPMDAAARKAMQEAHGLLCEKLFKFVGRHSFLDRGEVERVKRTRIGEGKHVLANDPSRAMSNVFIMAILPRRHGGSA
jgi:hypothetical protein